MDTQKHKEELDALTAFLSDADSLTELEKLTSQVNFFDIAGISRMEIRHSNILAWLFDPNENHGLGDKILRGFITLAARRKHEQDSSFALLPILMMEFEDFSVRREWHHIDILAQSASEKFVLCIENKIDSNEHGNQLELYANFIDQTYPDHTKLFVYLSPDGRDSSNTQRWLSMSYEDVLNVIQNALNSSSVAPEAQLLIQNYCMTIRRNIMGNDEITKLCNDIYRKHQKAIDLIIEHSQNILSMIAKTVAEWAQDKAGNSFIEFDPKTSCVKYTRFKTKAMDEIIPDAEKAQSAWKTNSFYYYEIVNLYGNELSIQLAINSTNIPNDLREISDKINEKYPSGVKNWNYRYPFRTEAIKVPGDLTPATIHQGLDKLLEAVFKFEDELKTKLNGNQ